MGGDGLAEGIDLVDLDVKLTGLDQVKNAVRVELEFLARHDVLHQRRAHDGHVLRGEPRDVEGWDCAGC